MGWYQIQNCTELQTAVDDLVNTVVPLSSDDEVIDHYVVDHGLTTELWILVYRDGAYEIVLNLIEDTGAAEGWWYKPLSESVHPYYYGCPVEWFGYEPVRGKSPEWRAACLSRC